MCQRLSGCEQKWPVTFLLQSSSMLFEPRCWCLRTMLWAVANGCPWGVWPTSYCCEVWPEAHSCDAAGIETALIWAHTAGCPCSSRVHRFIPWRKRATVIATRLSASAVRGCCSNWLSGAVGTVCCATGLLLLHFLRSAGTWGARRVRIKLLCILLFLVLSLAYNVKRHIDYKAQLDTLS
eukprot:1343-Heterococcus_DN1.PRE.1